MSDEQKNWSRVPDRGPMQKAFAIPYEDVAGTTNAKKLKSHVRYSDAENLYNAC